MLFESGDWAFVAGLLAIVGALTAAIAFGLSELNRRRPWANLLMSTLAAPVMVAIAAFILGRPDPRSPDVPGMILALLLELAFVSLPISLAASAVVVWLRRTPSPRSRS